VKGANNLTLFLEAILKKLERNSSQ
jgi:hypothetical protein